jgi:tripartite-type tricarboxylate transporter receptor subunit TctC
MTADTHHRPRRPWLRAALAALAMASGAVATSAAWADTWPKQPVRIVLAIGPGSSGDTLARMLRPKLAARWKQPVIIDNRPGASGVVGTEAVVRATDGHTLLLGTQSSFLSKFLVKGLKFDPEVDLPPVRKVLNYQLVIAVNAETAKQAGSMKDLVALSKKSDKGVFFAGLGPTSVFNLTLGVLNQQLGVNYTAVNYSNVGQANLALMRNDAQFIINNPASISPYFANGAIVPLVALGAQRYPQLPNVPTLQEAVGYSGYLPQLWTGFFVPKGTPAGVVDQINRDVTAVLADPGFRKDVEEKLSATVVASSPGAYAKDIHDEMAVWRQLFKTLNIQPE